MKLLDEVTQEDLQEARAWRQRFKGAPEKERTHLYDDLRKFVARLETKYSYKGINHLNELLRREQVTS